MPSTFKRRKKMKRIWITVFVFSMIGIVVFGTPIWNISTISIKGSSYYTHEEMMHEAGITQGMHILQVNKKRSMKQLRKLPYIASADISLTFPNAVEIIVTERNPVGYVPFSGTYLSIDKNGQVIDQSESPLSYDLPVVEGLKFNKFVLGEPLEVDNEESIMAIIEITTLMGKYDLLDKAVRIDVEDLGNIHLYIHSLDVIIGEISDLDKKMQWLCKIADQYKIGILDLSNIANGQAIMSPLM